MKYRELIVLLFFCAALAAPLISSAQSQPQPKKEFTHEETFVPNLNALCAGGQALSEGCDAIRARTIVDASAIPWRAIGRVNFASLKTRSHCTGTLVSERIVLTAAHCLFNESKLAWIPAQSLRFVAGYQRGTGVAVSGVEKYLLDPSLDLQSRNSGLVPAVDWALLVLKEPIGQETGFAKVTPISAQEIGKEPVAIAGYAGLRAHVLSVADECGSPAYRPSSGVIITGCAAMKGDSGGPLLIIKEDGLRVIGTLSAVFGSPKGLQNIIVPASKFISALQAEAG